MERSFFLFPNVGSYDDAMMSSCAAFIWLLDISSRIFYLAPVRSYGMLSGIGVLSPPPLTKLVQ